MAEELIKAVHNTRKRQIRDSVDDLEQSHVLTINSVPAEASSALDLQSQSSAANGLFEPGSISKFASGGVTRNVRQIGSCTLVCFCSCHKRTRLRTPSILRSVLGSIVLGFESLPLVAQTCDDEACRNHATTSITMDLALPQWFLHRIITIRATSELKRGPELLLRVLRVRSLDSPIFGALRRGNTEIIKRLLEKGDASVLDVAENGTSILNVS